MGKFDDLVDRPWTELTLYAESIPHLLHWDLAYLWILEKQQAVRPDKWKERVEAWKYLMSMLLMGQLLIDEATIEEPLIKYTAPFGIDTVGWVKIKGVDKVAGVLSPTVLVRPLPDYKNTLLDGWQSAAPDPGSRDPQGLRHLLQLAVTRLTEEHEDSFAGRLARCIRNEFNPLPIGNPPNTKSVQFPFLDRLSWSHRREEPRLKRLGLFLRTGGDPENLWIPRCENCDALLTRPEAEAAIIVESDVVTLNCLDCATANKLNISDFLLWLPEGQHAILWKRDGITSTPPKGFPPVPANTGSDLEFQWNPGPLRGELTKRFLKLKFPGRTVMEKSISEISYPSILVPGALSAAYAGLPFRSDWLHAVSNIHELRADVETGIQRVTYRNVSIKGLPVDVDIRFGSFSIEADRTVSVGVYPNPYNMPNSWKAYRAFLAGASRAKYAIRSSAHKSILPWVAEFDTGAPTAFSVETPDGRTGACFYNAFPEELSQNRPLVRREVNVGVDFGTSNTLVYVAPSGSNASNIVPEQFAIQPSKLSENVRLLAGDDGADLVTKRLTDFLPGQNHGESSVDPYLIPTAVWETTNCVLIRWNSTPPVPGLKETGNFKSKAEANSLRLAYLRELMFLTVPQMISQAGASRSEIKLNLGFAFPLSFGFDARQEMDRLLRDLSTELEKAGCAADCFSISESQACVRAFGTPRLNENFIVADMGGGTLDLALFTTGEDQRNVMHQIGSLRYAGEDYVTALAQHAQGGTTDLSGRTWEIRDAISSGESWRVYGRNSAAQSILQKFLGFAFEYLRTMLLAFKEGREGSAIKLVLVGNGWHLADAFSPEREQRSPQEVFEESHKHLVDQLSVPGVDLYLLDPLPALPSSKHLVVIGALQNAWAAQGVRELSSNGHPLSKLPAGRGMELGRAGAKQKRFSWYELVGDAIPLVGFTRADLTADSAFFLAEMPPLVDPWRQRLLKLFDCGSVQEIAYPTDPQIREQINHSIQGDPARVIQGPLQIILEQSWIRKLVN